MPLYFVQDKGGGVEGFATPDEALAYAHKEGGSILSGEAAAHHQMQFEAQGAKGALAAGAGSALFTLPKLAVGAFGTDEQRQFLEASEGYHPIAAFGGSFLAPWGAAGKFANAGVRGLFGLGEAAEAASVFGRGASVFAEGSALEGAALRGAEGGASALTDRHALSLFDEAAAAARPGYASEMGSIAGRPFTAEGAAIADAHPRSFLEAAAREGSLNAGVGAINSAGDYLLSERYMDGVPHEDAGSLTQAILHGALTGGLLGGAAGVVTHGAGKAVDAAFNPLHAPKARVPEAQRAVIEASFEKGGMTAAEAKAAASTIMEHGVAGTAVDSPGYNIVSAMLDNARVKRALERGEIQLPPSMAGEADLASFLASVVKKAQGERAGGKIPSAFSSFESFADSVATTVAEKRASVMGAARDAMSPELKAIFEAHEYGGELAASATEARAIGAPDVAKILDSADKIMETAGHTRLGRLQALSLMADAEALAPAGFHLDGERAVLGAPLQHEANGQKFLSALGEHQLAEKARRDIGSMAETFKAGTAPSPDAVTSLEQAAHQLGVKKAGGLDAAVRDHFENEAARAVTAETKKLDPVMKMLAGIMGGGVASKILGGFTGGYLGGKFAQVLAQAATDPIAASGSIRKALVMLHHGAADVERLAQGLSPSAAPKASLVNLAENLTPWGKVLWDTAPGRTARVVGQTLEDGFRALAPSMPQRAAAGMQIAMSIEQHLEQHEPKPVVPINVNPAAMANLPPRFNDREVAAYQTRLQATVEPKVVIAKFFETGELTKEAADTLRATHPYLVRDIVAKGAAQMAAAPESERYAMARQLEILAGPSGGYFSASSTPSFTATVQKNYAERGPQGPGPGGPSGNASPQKDPGPGGAQFAPVSVTRNQNGKFLQQTHASPSAALSTNLGSK